MLPASKKQPAKMAGQIVPEFESILVFDPRRSRSSIWNHCLLRMIPQSRFKVVTTMDEFKDALLNVRYHWTFAIINWDVESVDGTAGMSRLSTMRNIADKRYSKMPVCAFLEHRIHSAMKRLQLDDQPGVIVVEGHATPGTIIAAIKSKVANNENLFKEPTELTHAMDLFREKKFQASIDSLREAKLPLKFLSRKYAIMVHSYLKLGDIDAARSIFEELCNMKFITPSLFGLATKIYNKIGNKEWALKFAEIRYKAYPDDFNGARDFAKILSLDGRLTEAIDVLERELAKDSGQRGVIYGDMMGLLDEHGDMNGILKLITRDGFNIDPDGAIRLCHIAIRCCQENLWREALTIFNVASPHVSEKLLKKRVLYSIGREQLKAGATASALLSFATCLSMDPESDAFAKYTLECYQIVHGSNVVYNKRALEQAIKQRAARVSRILRQPFRGTPEELLMVSVPRLVELATEDAELRRSARAEAAAKREQARKRERSRKEARQDERSSDEKTVKAERQRA